MHIKEFYVHFINAHQAAVFFVWNDVLLSDVHKLKLNHLVMLKTGLLGED